MKKCCICGKELIGEGNNPYGAFDENFEHQLHFKPKDRCCDECNSTRVNPGRLLLVIKAEELLAGLDDLDDDDLD